MSENSDQDFINLLKEFARSSDNSVDEEDIRFAFPELFPEVPNSTENTFDQKTELKQAEETKTLLTDAEREKVIEDIVKKDKIESTKGLPFFEKLEENGTMKTSIFDEKVALDKNQDKATNKKDVEEINLPTGTSVGVGNANDIHVEQIFEPSANDSDSTIQLHQQLIDLQEKLIKNDFVISQLLRQQAAQNKKDKAENESIQLVNKSLLVNLETQKEELEKKLRHAEREILNLRKKNKPSSTWRWISLGVNLLLLAVLLYSNRHLYIENTTTSKLEGIELIETKTSHEVVPTDPDTMEKEVSQPLVNQVSSSLSVSPESDGSMTVNPSKRIVVKNKRMDYKRKRGPVNTPIKNTISKEVDMQGVDNRVNADNNSTSKDFSTSAERTVEPVPPVFFKDAD